MNLIDLRNKKNLTLQQVAEQIGCTKQAYWNYEKGLRKIPLSRAVILSQIYGITVEEIFFYSSSNQSVNKNISV